MVENDKLAIELFAVKDKSLNDLKKVADITEKITRDEERYAKASEAARNSKRQTGTPSPSRGGGEGLSERIGRFAANARTPAAVMGGFALIFSALKKLEEVSKKVALESDKFLNVRLPKAETKALTRSIYSMVGGRKEEIEEDVFKLAESFESARLGNEADRDKFTRAGINLMDETGKFRNVPEIMVEALERASALDEDNARALLAVLGLRSASFKKMLQVLEGEGKTAFFERYARFEETEKRREQREEKMKGVESFFREASDSVYETKESFLNYVVPSQEDAEPAKRVFFQGGERITEITKNRAQLDNEIRSKVSPENRAQNPTTLNEEERKALNSRAVMLPGGNVELLSKEYPFNQVTNSNLNNERNNTVYNNQRNSTIYNSERSRPAQNKTTEPNNASVVNNINITLNTQNSTSGQGSPFENRQLVRQVEEAIVSSLERANSKRMVV